MGNVDRSELAIWAEGTSYTTDDLASAYADYWVQEQRAGRDPLPEGRWAHEVVGIPIETDE